MIDMASNSGDSLASQRLVVFYIIWSILVYDRQTLQENQL